MAEVGPSAVPDQVSLSEATRTWARIAALSFGGPAGQIATMHRILVEEERWIGDDRFLHALNCCMLLPGPEAQQLATYIGWLMHRTKGGLIAGALFILPGFASILALSFVYVLLGRVSIVEGLFFGLKAAVLALVLQAVIRVGSRSLRNATRWTLALTSFVAIVVLDVPFPVIVLAAALIGFLATRMGIHAFAGGGHRRSGGAHVADRKTVLGEGLPDHACPNLPWTIRISSALAVLWLVPVTALFVALGHDDVLSRIATFFSEMAMVTFARIGISSLQVPTFETLNVAALVLTLAAIVATFRYKLGVLVVLAGAAAGGIVLKLAGLG